MLRVCTTCLVGKPHTEFYKTQGGKYGLRADCKACVSIYRKAKRVEHPERFLEASRARQARVRVEDPLYFVKQILSDRKRGARVKGVPFSLTLSNLPPIPSHCPILGVALEHCSGLDTAPSLDRLIPSLGYVPGNVAWISGRANRIKNNATADELERIAAWVRTQEALK